MGFLTKIRTGSFSVEIDGLLCTNVEERCRWDRRCRKRRPCRICNDFERKGQWPFEGLGARVPILVPFDLGRFPMILFVNDRIENFYLNGDRKIFRFRRR